MARGLIDTSYIDWPANVDNAYLRGLQTRAGVSFTEIAGRLDAALGELNAGVDPFLANLLAPPTAEPAASGGRTDRMRAERRSQYTVARPQLVERRAHMLAMYSHEISLGFTEDGLNRMSLQAIQDQIDGMRDGWAGLRRAETLGRLFSDAEVPVDEGTTATSPGFAGSGTGTNVFSGTYADGTALPGGYSHYVRDTTANRAAAIRAQRDKLKRMGHPAPYDLIGSQVAVDAIVALGEAGGFVRAGTPLVRLASGTSEAQVDPMTYVGVFDGDVRVQLPILDFTADNFVVFKTYGAFNPRNPIVWRYDPLYGPDIFVRSRELYPLALAVSIGHFAPNVNDRTAAAPTLMAASGNYIAPTITY
jgi:hypothetical protein